MRPAARLAVEERPAARIAGLAVAVLGIVWLWLQRRHLDVESPRHRGSLGGVLLRAALILAVLGLVMRFAPPVRTGEEGSGEAMVGRPGSEVSPEAPRLETPPPPPPTPPMTEGFSPEGSVLEPDAAPPPPLTQTPPPPERPPLDLGFLRSLGGILVLILLLALVVVTFRLLRGGVPRLGEDAEPELEDEAELEEPTGAAEAEAGLEASLEQLAHDDGDPRRQIAAAYHRLLAALAAAGAAREPQEAPHEHLHRALGPLGVRAEPLHRLASLYVAAEFSEHPVTERHRAAAVDALERSLADLRTWSGAIAALGLRELVEAEA